MLASMLAFFWTKQQIKNTVVDLTTCINPRSLLILMQCSDETIYQPRGKNSFLPSLVTSLGGKEFIPTQPGHKVRGKEFFPTQPGHQPRGREFFPTQPGHQPPKKRIHSMGPWSVTPQRHGISFTLFLLILT